MNQRMPVFSFAFLALFAFFVSIVSPLAGANEDDDGYYYGPGMMGGFGYGPGRNAMQGFGNGYGMGPGMMGGNGLWMGRSMMGGYGGPFDALNLSPEQRQKIRDIQREQRRAHWATMEKIADEQDQLSDLYAADVPDAKKIGAAVGRIAKLRQDQIEADVNAWNRMQSVLTKEQKDQIKQWRENRGRGYGGAYGPGNPPPGMGPGMMRR